MGTAVIDCLYMPHQHAFCMQCGSGLWQSPKGRDFRAIFPTTLQYECGDKLCTLPAELMPTSHINYDNRCMDWTDDLPKLDGTTGKACNNDGSPVEEKV
eukprot:m.91663 g.91663  ORF g.91663 m.91663 type:complete len:99 (-) comp9917_c2_seq2:53-349(-)